MATVLEQASTLVRKRLSELDEEKGRLEKALSGLGGKPAGRARPRRRAAAKPRGGSRAAGAVQLISSKPGITASDIAKVMKIKPNYLYRVLGDLEKAGTVRKDGREYFPA